MSGATADSTIGWTAAGAGRARPRRVQHLQLAARRDVRAHRLRDRGAQLPPVGVRHVHLCETHHRSLRGEPRASRHQRRECRRGAVRRRGSAPDLEAIPEPREAGRPEGRPPPSRRSAGGCRTRPPPTSPGSRTTRSAPCAAGLNMKLMNSRASATLRAPAGTTMFVDSSRPPSVGTTKRSVWVTCSASRISSARATASSARPEIRSSMYSVVANEPI